MHFKRMLFLSNLLSQPNLTYYLSVSMPVTRARVKSGDGLVFGWRPVLTNRRRFRKLIAIKVRAFLSGCLRDG